MGEIEVGTKCAVEEKKCGSGVLIHRHVRWPTYKNKQLRYFLRGTIREIQAQFERRCANYFEIGHHAFDFLLHDEPS